MTNLIKHRGIVENINGAQVQVKIVQTTACSACSANKHCSSAESKEKIIEIYNTSEVCRIGDEVEIIGETSLGMKAVLLAFVLPFLILVVSLFLFMNLTSQNELASSLYSLLLTGVYYMVLRTKKEHLKKNFSFTIKPIK